MIIKFNIVYKFENALDDILKRNSALIFFILIVSFFTSCLTIKVQAATVYSLNINVNDSFTWEITDLNKHNFEKVFGFEPTFEKGDQIRKIIRDIIDSDTGWTIVTEDWDYGSDFSKKGVTKYNSVSNDPKEYNDNIFIPTPVNDYLIAAKNTSSAYIIQGSTIIKRTSNYRMEKEYDYRGVLVSEAYYDDDNILMVKVEGKFRIIPLGNYFVGFIAFAIVGVIIVMKKKKLIRVVNAS